MVKVNYSDRLNSLPPYLFVEIDRKKKDLMAKGVDIINLGVGDPDNPTPQHIIKAGKKALDDPKNHVYPFGIGLKRFREAVAAWYSERFGVKLDIDTEITSLIGSKEGIGHIHLGFVNQGDVVLVPEPGYPVYNGATVLAGGVSHFMPLLEENDFLPDIESIPKEVLKKAKLMFLNYPNNPTSATANRGFFESVIKLAKEYNIIVCHDAAYSEMYYSKEKPMSFLELDGAKEVGIEFHSLSKTYNMTGWRIGWACGNKDVIKGLVKVKANIDSGAFQMVQEAAVAALTGPQNCTDKMRALYKERRDILLDGFSKLGWKTKTPEASFYVWIKVPKGYNSIDTASIIMDKAGVVVTPGVGFGKSGEGYIRMALTVDKKRIEEALGRIGKIKW
ncbi:MAG: LL-diaminopimelate aminotransferase [bacterium]